MFQTNDVEKIKTHFVFNYLFFRQPCHLCDTVEKYCRTGQATGGNMADTHCMLDT